ncbi:MAG TPA: 1-deoxy-D-xylulose-5-phosphate reductoisomerase, partial [Bacillota bacterium]
ALANKETLVAAGSLIMSAAARHGVKIIPVDSEHSAIFQCLEGKKREDVERLVLTASGGPFRTYTPEQLETVTLEQALQHPNWQMGSKITIDSATMFNKGLEIIEAHWLFGMPFEQITPVIHSESIVHSLVEFKDGSFLAQLGLCDMRLPIQLALTYPKHLASPFPKLNFKQRMVLNFEPVNPRLFPAIELAYEAGRKGGSLPAVLNAANEEAVTAFLARKIGFTQISRIVSEVMGYHQQEAFSTQPDLEEILAADQWARSVARRLIDADGR